LKSPRSDLEMISCVVDALPTMARASDLSSKCPVRRY
jgi:hypothetical protein